MKIPATLLAALMCASVVALNRRVNENAADNNSGKELKGAERLPKPAPEMQRLSTLFLGTWSTSEKHESGRIAPRGGVGLGTDTVRLGPGGMSLISDYRATDPMGRFLSHGILWWDAHEQGYRGVECQNRSPGGCDVGSIWKWEGKDLVAHEQGIKEVFTDLTPTSRTFYMDVSEDGSPLKRLMTIKYIKVR